MLGEGRKQRQITWKCGKMDAKRLHGLTNSEAINFFVTLDLCSCAVVAKLMVTECTKGCQMKDMDFFFPLMTDGFM